MDILEISVLVFLIMHACLPVQSEQPSNALVAEYKRYAPFAHITTEQNIQRKHNFNQMLLDVFPTLHAEEQTKTAQFLLQQEKDDRYGYNFAKLLTPKTFCLLLKALLTPERNAIAEEFIHNKTKFGIIDEKIQTDDFIEIFLLCSKNFQIFYAKKRIFNLKYANNRFEAFFRNIAGQT